MTKNNKMGPARTGRHPRPSGPRHFGAGRGEKRGFGGNVGGTGGRTLGGNLFFFKGHGENGGGGKKKLRGRG